MKRDMPKLVRRARKAGWSVTKTGKQHWRFRSPNGATIFAPSTPSDRRSVMNVRANLRRAGLEV
jgi:hypothetical protein